MMVLIAFMWSTAGVVSRQLDSASGFEVTFWRSFFCALGLLVILPKMRGGFLPLWQQSRQAGSALWLSGLCWAVMFTAFMVALLLTTVANLLVIMALGPLFTALLARIFIKQQIPIRTWWAIGLAGIGIAWIYSGQIRLDGSRLAGPLIGLLVPLAGACNWTVVQHSRSKPGKAVDLMPAVLLGALLSMLAMLPLAVPFSATASDIGWLAFLGIFQLAVPCVLSVWCASVLKAPEIALLALLEVIFGIVLAWAGASEVPDMRMLSGGMLVISALVANEWLGWRQSA